MLIFRKQFGYATEVAEKLSSLGIFADVDNGDNTLPKKIRNGEIAQYNFIFGAFFLHLLTVEQTSFYLI